MWPGSRPRVPANHLSFESPLRGGFEPTRASAVILAEGAPAAPCAMLRTEVPYLAFARRRRHHPSRRDTGAPGIHALAWVAPSAVLGRNVSIAPFASVGEGAVIGDDVVIGPHVAIGRRRGDRRRLPAPRQRLDPRARAPRRPRGRAGRRGHRQRRLRVRAAADGTHQKIPQRGRVVIEDDVEIGANTDHRSAGRRARRGSGPAPRSTTSCRSAHGVRVGATRLLRAQVGIAGSTTVGDDVVLAGQVGVAGHLTIGDRVTATAQTGIPNSVDAGAVRVGLPGDPQPRLAQVVGRVPPPAGAEEGAARPRGAARAQLEERLAAGVRRRDPAPPRMSRVP